MYQLGNMRMGLMGSPMGSSYSAFGSPEAPGREFDMSDPMEQMKKHSNFATQFLSQPGSMGANPFSYNGG